MNGQRASPVLRYLAQWDRNVCLALNRHAESPAVARFFRVISRLGDGAIWYGMMVVFPLALGTEGLWLTLKMGVSGLTGLAIYKLLKSKTERPRPYVVYGTVTLAERPLDQFSFPSGHTLHAFAFSIIVVDHLPAFGVILVPFVGLVAVSRMVLGLHFPSDVLSGAGVGIGVGTGVLYGFRLFGL